MRILVTGAGGQLGRHLTPVAAGLGETIASGRTNGDFPMDLSVPGNAETLLDQTVPDIVINTAAYTDVDRAEDEPDAARALNADLPARLAQWCRRHRSLLVHFSTDYVFSGAGERPWREDDRPDPVNAYGASKLAGERMIEQSECAAVILRTAWVYSAFPGNFLSAILARAAEGETLRVVADQTGSPTWAGTLADATGAILEAREKLGPGRKLFHVAGRGTMSWYEFARLALERAAACGILSKRVAVEPVASEQWPQRAIRPRWSALDCRRFEQFTTRPLPTVEQGLTACLQQWESDQC